MSYDEISACLAGCLPWGRRRIGRHEILSRGGEFEVSNKSLFSTPSVQSIVSDCQCMMTDVRPFDLAPGKSRVVRGSVVVPVSPQSVAQKIAIRSNSLSHPVKMVVVRFNATRLNSDDASLADRQPGRREGA